MALQCTNDETTPWFYHVQATANLLLYSLVMTEQICGIIMYKQWDKFVALPCTSDGTHMWLYTVPTMDHILALF